MKYYKLTDKNGDFCSKGHPLLGDGINKECADFSTPDNFPLVIVEAIKEGKMRGLGTPKGLLLDALYVKWDAEWDAVYATSKLLDDVDAKWQAELDDVDAKWQAELDAVEARWMAEWEAVGRTKWQAELDAVRDKFWDLFAIPENRNPAWR